ncbi:MAG: FkbM family methyltransferase [Patescibacteria group bacterium]
MFKYGPVKKLKATLRPIKHFLFGKKEIYEVIDIVKRNNQGSEDCRVVFDVGAAVGDTAVTFLKSFPKATVYCFEPLPESFAALKRNIAGFGERVRCFNFALSDRNGVADFYMNANHDSSSFVTKPSGVGGATIKVNVRRLDDVIRELGIEKIDFMKVDVEGWEKEFIDGGKTAFKEKIDNLFIEINPVYCGGERKHFYIDVLEMIYAAGFSWVGVFGDFFFTKNK